MKRQPQPHARRRSTVQRAAARNERLLRGIEAQQRLDAEGTHGAAGDRERKTARVRKYLRKSRD